jgi:hypothetical protein
MDMLRIIWKWKITIFTGTIVFAVIAAYFSYAKPLRHRATSVVEFIPIVITDGIHKSVRDMDISKKVKSDVQIGLFDKKIIEYLNAVDKISLKKLSKIKIGYVGDKKYLKFSYASRDPKLGVKVLNALIQVLKNSFGAEIKVLQDGYIHAKKSKIQLLENQIVQAKSEINFISNRIKELDSDISNLNRKSQTDSSVEQQNDDSLETMVHENLIRQDRELMKSYYEEKFQHAFEIKKRKFTIKESELKIQYYEKDIDLFVNKVNIEQFVNILKSPEEDVKAVRRRPKLNVFLGAFAGFLFMAFLSIVLDYFTPGRANQLE